MAAYVIVNIDVRDPVRYEDYKRQAAPTVAAYGGRYVVRGGAAEVLEGTWVPKRVVVLEFPSMARAREWYRSADYAPARTLRHATAASEMILVEGA
jgi:uncharacterized protein (DUF1330 family)